MGVESDWKEVNLWDIVSIIRVSVKKVKVDCVRISITSIVVLWAPTPVKYVVLLTLDLCQLEILLQLFTSDFVFLSFHHFAPEGLCLSYPSRQSGQSGRGSEWWRLSEAEVMKPGQVAVWSVTLLWCDLIRSANSRGWSQLQWSFSYNAIPPSDTFAAVCLFLVCPCFHL